MSSIAAAAASASASSSAPTSGSTTTATMNEVQDFINGALFIWVDSCLPHPEVLSSYESLYDGTVLHKIWLQIDPEPPNHPISLSSSSSSSSPSSSSTSPDDELILLNTKIKNFDCIVKNVKTLFEEELGQTVLALPDCFILGNSPDSRAGIEQMKLLLTLLLGAAVQCPNKQIFINRIKELDVNIQHAIVELIKQVTDNQTLVLQNDYTDQLPPEIMYQHIMKIAKERDRYQTNWITQLATSEAESKLSTTNHLSSSASVSGMSVSNLSKQNYSANDNNQLAVEVADLKSKLRKLRQELEEKSESYIEIKEELDHKQNQYEKLRIESQKWYAESRQAAAYRDEVDVLQERSERLERLELEVQRFREKLSDSEFFRARVEELREDNRMLLETKEMLEEQLNRSRKRSDHVMALESEIITYKQKLNDLSLERDADKSKLQDLLDENTQLILVTKSMNSVPNLSNLSSGSSIASSKLTTDFNDDDDCQSGDNSLSEQLTNNAQTRVLKLELENRRLQQQLELMRETSFTDAANKFLDSDKDRKRLSLKLEQLQENYNRLTGQNHELEDVFKNALEENKKLQDLLTVQQQTNERQYQERELDRMKLIDAEKHVEILTKEKQRIQTIGESTQRRTNDLERFLDSKTKELESMKLTVTELETKKMELMECEEKIQHQEREMLNAQKEVIKLRESVEEKDIILDKNSCNLKAQINEIEMLRKHIDDDSKKIVKLQELTTKHTELESRSKVLEETVQTLQTNLVERDLVSKKMKKELEKIGFEISDSVAVIGSNNDKNKKSNTGVAGGGGAGGGGFGGGVDDDGSVTFGLENIDLSVESVVNKLVKNPETFKVVKEIMLAAGKDIYNDNNENNTQTIIINNKSSDICVLCHKKEIFTVEKNIVISSIDDCDTVGDNYNEKNRIIEQNTFDLLTNDKFKHLQNENFELQSTIEMLQGENARKSVDVSTLSSQIISLNTQHVALQLANSQLATEKEILVKKIDNLKIQNSVALHHHKTLQCLHDQLSGDYELLTNEKEELKTILRDLRIDQRDTKERELQLINEVDGLQKQITKMRKENENLLNLRTEHSKLKDDFRNLFTTSDGLKNEYKNIQEQYKIIRTENGQLRLENTKLTDELNVRLEQLKGLDIEFTKSTQRCDMLLHMNTNLDIDRRTLMDHVSQLLSQYHELLAHSLDDKQHYHDEEKLFTDKVNNLHRQKEKLEEKIMEHYKKLDSCSPKKKTFGASFVKRVKKASTDFINKVPSRNRRSWIDDPRLTQSEIQLGGSESGGNESDNSIEEPHSIATSETHLLQRNCRTRQSLQRNPMKSITGGHDYSLEMASSSSGRIGGNSGGVCGLGNEGGVGGSGNSSIVSGGGVGGLGITSGGVRNSFHQAPRRSGSLRSHHRHLQSTEQQQQPTDETNSNSLTLGTAGSRRTVYLIDDKVAKLTDPTLDNKTGSNNNKQIITSSESSTVTSTITSAPLTTATIEATRTTTSPSLSSNSKNDDLQQQQQPPPPTIPSTFLMYNRISNITAADTSNLDHDCNSHENLYANCLQKVDNKMLDNDGGGGGDGSGSSIGALGGGGNGSGGGGGGGGGSTRGGGKDSDIWYEYGCV